MPTTPSGTRIKPTWMPDGTILEIGDLADGIGQRRDLPRVRSPSTAIVSGAERQPVDERGVVSGSDCGARCPRRWRRGASPHRAADGAAIASERGILARVSARATRARGTRAPRRRRRMYAPTSAKVPKTGDGEIGHRGIVLRQRRMRPRARSRSAARRRGSETSGRFVASRVRSASARPRRSRAGSRRRRAARTGPR